MKLTIPSQTLELSVKEAALISKLLTSLDISYTVQEEQVQDEDPLLFTILVSSSTRVKNCLKRYANLTLSQFVDQCSISQLLKIRNFGQDCLKQLQQELNKYNYTLK